MRGSLDHPPIVIHTARWKSLWYLLLCLMFTGFGALAITVERPSLALWWAYVSVVFFGAGVLLLLWRLVRPDTLTLDLVGVTWRSLWRTMHWPWTAIANFRPIVITTATRHVGFDFVGDPARATRLRAVNRAFAGAEASFGGGWELGATKLAALLDDARARWV